MTSLQILKIYATSLATFLIIDFTWLGFVARRFYQKHLGQLLKPSVNWPAAFVFYLLFVAGLVYFVILPGLGKKPLTTTFISAFFYGVVTYATYDLTNLATLKDWSLTVTLVDIFWGGLLSLLVTVATFFLLGKLG